MVNRAIGQGEVPAEWHDDMRAAWEREKLRADAAENLLRRIAKANVIFPSMCSNNMEAYNLTDELRRFIDTEVPNGRS